MNERQRIQESILNTAVYYGRQLTAPVISMMADDFQGHSADSVVGAYEAYRRNGKNRTFPLPAQIIEILDGGNSRQNAAAMVVNLIAAVQRNDYTWPMQLNKSAYQTGTFEGDFRAELGDAAWDAVRLHGGWQNFCDSYWNCRGNETAFKAQLREVLEGAIEKRSNGDLLPFQRLQALPGVQPQKKNLGPNPQEIAMLRAEAEGRGMVALVDEIDRLVKKKDGASQSKDERS